ncbi:MAG TPA: amidohydrolase family protein [Chloroflexota bacterium]|nr:amidohydrolase family protein [Chloroflexota bacterium]
MAIDVHAHLYPPAYLDVVRKLEHEGGAVGAAAQRTLHAFIRQDPVFTEALDERLALMDAAGIERQVLSFSTPNIWHPDVAVRSALVRAFNDACAEVAARYPGRFALFASVPLPFVDAAIAEAARALDELGAVGIGICTHIADRPVDAPEFEPFYAYLDARGAALFFHPDGFCAPGVLDEYLLAWGVGVLFDDTLAALRLAASGLVARYPRITWIVPHLGGTIPFVIGRLDRVWRNGQRFGLLSPAQAALPEPPSVYLRRLYYDTVTYQVNALVLAREVLGVERLVFGSDFPYNSRQNLATGREQLAAAGFTPAELARVLRANSAAALGLDPRAEEKRQPRS